MPLAILLSVPGVTTGGVAHSTLSAVVGFGYFVTLEATGGATLGKRLLGLRVADVTGNSPITIPSSARRNWWMLLGALSGADALPLIAGMIGLVIVSTIGATIMRDDHNRGWHDKTAQTTVRRAS